MSELEEKIFNINSEEEFNGLALDVFNIQYRNNSVYKLWVDLIKVNPAHITHIAQIPFLPIGFFKSKEIVCEPRSENPLIFTSSSTTSQTPSKHFVSDVKIYENSFSKGFHHFYGDVKDYCILALLPGYLQRQGSSLVYMFNCLIKDSQHPLSGFFLNNIDSLIANIQQLKKQKQKTLLIGVSYALMDLADKGIELDENFIVMETGGMKGTRKELLKEELHAYLKRGFHINTIHSEYGMTELLSQAYSKDQTFNSPPWMKFLIREVTDPLNIRHDNKTGGINVIDLANINSCSFIATQDLGRMNPEGKLELMGRYDNSDVRGCNLMLDA
ncbi:MAG: putative acyl protein synthase/acyl-CoA reductase-like protein [Bacteroidetes bacterium]|nr:putative acyl protein synthase/acyl-CoA reductase-like protein [Bacteroidota bacterium]